MTVSFWRLYKHASPCSMFNARMFTASTVLFKLKLQTCPRDLTLPLKSLTQLPVSINGLYGVSLMEQKQCSAVTLLAPDARCGGLRVRLMGFRMPRSFRDSSVWSAPLLQVDSLGPRWLGKLSYAAEPRQCSFFSSVVTMETPGGGVDCGLSLSYIYLHSFISVFRLK